MLYATTISRLQAFISKMLSVPYVLGVYFLDKTDYNSN